MSKESQMSKTTFVFRFLDDVADMLSAEAELALITALAHDHPMNQLYVNRRSFRFYGYRGKRIRFKAALAHAFLRAFGAVTTALSSPIIINRATRFYYALFEKMDEHWLEITHEIDWMPCRLGALDHSVKCICADGASRRHSHLHPETCAEACMTQSDPDAWRVELIEEAGRMSEFMVSTSYTDTIYYWAALRLTESALPFGLALMMASDFASVGSAITGAAFTGVMVSWILYAIWRVRCRRALRKTGKMLVGQGSNRPQAICDDDSSDWRSWHAQLRSGYGARHATKEHSSHLLHWWLVAFAVVILMLVRKSVM